MISAVPQWSPVMKTGNTDVAGGRADRGEAASMEPGHEDREYPPSLWGLSLAYGVPQWSPVMKTGNTCIRACVGGQPPACLNGARS